MSGARDFLCEVSNTVIGCNLSLSILVFRRVFSFAYLLGFDDGKYMRNCSNNHDVRPSSC
jgi:hypothetical protein